MSILRVRIANIGRSVAVPIGLFTVSIVMLCSADEYRQRALDILREWHQLGAGGSLEPDNTVTLQYSFPSVTARKLQLTAASDNYAGVGEHREIDPMFSKLLQKTPPIKRLRLKGRRITASCLDELTSHSIQWLILDYAEADEAVFETIASNHHILALSMIGTQVDDGTFRRMLRQMPQLRILNLSGTTIHASCATIGQLKSLHSLCLINTNIDDECVFAMNNLNALRDLSLAGTHISDKCVDTLATLTSLKWIAIDRTHISRGGYEKLLARLPKETVIISSHVSPKERFSLP